MVKQTFIWLFAFVALTASAQGGPGEAYLFSLSNGSPVRISNSQQWTLSGPRLPPGSPTSPPVYVNNLFIASPINKWVALVSCDHLAQLYNRMPEADQKTIIVEAERERLDFIMSRLEHDADAISRSAVERVSIGETDGWTQTINHKPKGFKTFTMGSPYTERYNSPDIAPTYTCVVQACIIIGSRFTCNVSLHGPNEEATRRALSEIIESLSTPSASKVQDALAQQGPIECSLTPKSNETLRLRLPPGHIPDHNVNLLKGTYEGTLKDQGAALRFSKADNSSSVVMWQERQSVKRHQANSPFSNPFGWIAARASNWWNALIALQRLPIPFSTQVTETDSVDLISTRVAFGKFGHGFAAICEIKTNGGDSIHCITTANTRENLDATIEAISQAKLVKK